MTKIYGISRSDIRRLISINPSTGITTEIATFTGLLPNTVPSGIAIDKNDKCFIVATDSGNHNTISTLYECDLETAKLTLVGTQSIAPDLHDITASCDDTIYGTDSTQGALYSINKHTGDASLVGSLNTLSDDYVINVTYDRKLGEIYNYVLDSGGYFTAFAKLSKETGTASYVSETYKFGTYVGASQSTCANFNSLDINPGFNGAWYEPETNGQGFMFDIYPESNTFFATWFTFDQETSKTEGTSSFGSPEQRWFAAQGELGDGDTVDLTIYSNSQGVFDSTNPVQTDAVGTMTVSFEDCAIGAVEYAFDDSDISGVIPIRRVSNDNVELCNILLNTDK